MPKAQSSISAICSGAASRTTRRIVSTPKAAWRDSSCSMRWIVSVSSGFRHSRRIMSMIPTAMPSKRVCMPSVFCCAVRASSRISSRILSVEPIG